MIRSRMAADAAKAIDRRSTSAALSCRGVSTRASSKFPNLSEESLPRYGASLRVDPPSTEAGAGARVDDVEVVGPAAIAAAHDREAVALDRVGLRGKEVTQRKDRLGLAHSRPRRPPRPARPIADDANRSGVRLWNLRVSRVPPPRASPDGDDEDNDDERPPARRSLPAARLLREAAIG